MKQLNLTIAVTVILLVSMQITSAIAVFRAALDIKDYLSLWAPFLTLVVGYWFRGDQRGGTGA